MNRRALMTRVARGVKLLDEKDPLWWNGSEGVGKAAIDGMVGHIDLEKLDLSDCSLCILGQRQGDYTLGLTALGLHDFGSRFDLGFSIERALTAELFPTLTELWASVIQSRRFPRRKIASDPWIMKVNKTWVREVRS